MFVPRAGNTRFALLVQSAKFELVFLLVIVLNAIFMALQLQYSGHSTGFSLGVSQYTHNAESEMPWARVVLEIGELSFTAIFAIELILRLVALRLKFIFFFWSWMDTVIVTLAVLDQFGMMSAGNAFVIRLLRLGKLIRFIKILQVATKFDSVFFIMRSIHSSLDILFWSLFILITVQLVVGIMMNQIMRSFIEDESLSEDLRIQIFLHWGTFARAMLTMFQVTLGGWGPSFRLIVDHLSEWLGGIYIIYICIVRFGILSVITSVFVQKTHENAQNDAALALKEQERTAGKIRAKLSMLFDSLDLDGNGTLTHQEFMDLVNEPNVTKWLKLLDVDLEDLDQLFIVLDDGDFASLAVSFICFRILGVDFRILKSPGRTFHGETYFHIKNTEIRRPEAKKYETQACQGTRRKRMNHPGKPFSSWSPGLLG